MESKSSQPKGKFVWIWGLALACSGCPCTLSISLLELISYQIQEEFQEYNMDIVEIIRKSLFLPIIITAPISCLFVSLGVPFRPLLIGSTILYVIFGSLIFFVYNLTTIIIIRSLFGICVGILEGVSMALMPLSIDFYPKSITRPMLAGARAGFGSIVSCLCTFIAPAVSSTHNWRTLCLFCLVVALYIPAWCITPDPFEGESDKWILRRMIKEHKEKMQFYRNKSDSSYINIEESEILNRRSMMNSKDQFSIKNSEENRNENDDSLYTKAVISTMRELSKEVDDNEHANNKKHKQKKKHNSIQDFKIDKKLTERRVSTLADLSCNIDFNKTDTELNKDIIDSIVKEKKHKHHITSEKPKQKEDDENNENEENEEKESLISESYYEENTYEVSEGSSSSINENIEPFELSIPKDLSEKLEQQDHITATKSRRHWRIEDCPYPVKFIPVFVFCLVVQIFNSGLIANTDSHIRHVVVNDPVANEMTVQTMIVVFDSLCYFMNGLGSLIVPLIWILYLKIPALVPSTGNYLLAATSLLGLGIGFIMLSIIVDYRVSTVIASSICGIFGGFIVPDCNMWSTKVSPPMWLFFSMGLLTSATNIAKYISPWVISSISSLEKDIATSQKQYLVGGSVLMVMFLCYFTLGTAFAIYSHVKSKKNINI